MISREIYLQSKEDYEYTVKRYDLIAERQKQDSISKTIQIKNIKESLESMRKNTQIIRERVDNLEIKSPESGQLGNLDVVLGQNVASGARIGVIKISPIIK